MRRFLRRERLRRARRLIRRAERAVEGAIHPEYRTFLPEGGTVQLDIVVKIPHLSFEELQAVDPDEVAETAREQFVAHRRKFVKGSYDYSTR